MQKLRRVAVFTERQVGIGSAAAALEPYLRSAPNVTWTDVTYLEPNGFIERLPLPKRLRGPLRGFLQTANGLRRGPYEALLFLTHNPAVLHQQAIGRTPTLLWTDVTPALLDRQAAHYEHAVDTFAPLRLFKQAAVRRAFHRAALCVGWSDWARRSFIDDYGVAEDRTRVVPPGIDLEHWKVCERGARSSVPRILFVGGDFVRKGGNLLLDVFRQHMRGRCELDLVTRDAVAEEDGVRVHRGMTARSPGLLELYRNADLFVLPTRGDCFSIASLEAMASGLPVVVSAVGGIREIIDQARSGYAIPPDDGAALRSVLEGLLADRDRMRAMGVCGRSIVEERFDARRTATTLAGLLDAIEAPRRS